MYFHYFNICICINASHCVSLTWLNMNMSICISISRLCISAWTLHPIDWWQRVICEVWLTGVSLTWLNTTSNWLMPEDIICEVWLTFYHSSPICVFDYCTLIYVLLFGGAPLMVEFAINRTEQNRWRIARHIVTMSSWEMFREMSEIDEFCLITQLLLAPVAESNRFPKQTIQYVYRNLHIGVRALCSVHLFAARRQSSQQSIMYFVNISQVMCVQRTGTWDSMTRSHWDSLIALIACAINYLLRRGDVAQSVQQKSRLCTGQRH
jgi:hypothetical protein